MEPSQTAGQLADGTPVPARDWKVWTERVLRWALAILFLVAGAPKILHADQFAEAVNNYHLLSMTGVNWMVIVLPWLEVVCALALLGGIAVRGAAFLLVVLLVVFIIAIASGIHRGLDISCGCFGMGESGKRVGYEEIVRDAAMLAAAIAVWVMSRPVRSKE